MGVGDFIENPQPFSAPYSQSVFVPDYIVNPHPRFAALATNIRSRRGSKVHMAVPLFHDTHTPEFLRTNGSAEAKALSNGMEEPDTFLHMDAMAFGMGMCCLQVTLQARDVDESR
jgi:glutamate--cysteine ligase catalytic subunit